MVLNDTRSVPCILIHFTKTMKLEGIGRTTVGEAVTPAALWDTAECTTDVEPNALGVERAAGGDGVDRTTGVVWVWTTLGAVTVGGGGGCLRGSAAAIEARATWCKVLVEPLELPAP
jgi:hypothetical protein